MCYVCELKRTIGDKTLDEYLSIRCDYGAMNAQMTELLSRMLAFERLRRPSPKQKEAKPNEPQD